MPKKPDDHAETSEKLRRDSGKLMDAAKKLRASQADLVKRMKELAERIADRARKK